MSMTDPIADMLTRIRNAQQAGHRAAVIPRSGIKLAIVAVLKNEGFIEGYIEDPNGAQGNIKMFLRYDANNRGAIRGLERISKPGKRCYVGREDVPRVRNGLGCAILTTPRGVITDRQARAAGIGGEVICHVW
jgi:small subunit ribosomal protein S8